MRGDDAGTTGRKGDMAELHSTRCISAMISFKEAGHLFPESD
jgi:hypothetical protein